MEVSAFKDFRVPQYQMTNLYNPFHLFAGHTSVMQVCHEAVGRWLTRAMPQDSRWHTTSKIYGGTQTSNRVQREEKSSNNMTEKICSQKQML
jgi:hypothetical protein